MPAVAAVDASKHRISVRLPAIRKRPKSRRAFDIGETNHRVISLMKTADDGRKLLPPLSREKSMFRKPKKSTTLSLTPEEAAVSHWNRNFRVVSFQSDRLVVNHLRKKLTKRLDQRFFETLDDEVKTNSIESTHKHKENARTVPDAKKVQPQENTNIFASYSEVGDKMKEQREQKSSAEEINSSKSETAQPNDPPSASKVKGRKKSSLKHSASPVHKSVTLEKPNDVHRGPESTNEQGVEIPTETEQTVDEDNYRELIISPVQTPSVYRPETRERTRVSFSAQMSRTLRGQVHKPCPPDSRIIKLYVASNYTDTSAERTAMIENVYPAIKAHCLERGKELQIYDLHWGMPDSTCDDHKVPDISKDILNQCLASDKGINFLMVLGEKYGEYLLPSSIPPDEFEDILSAVGIDRLKQMKFIQVKLNEIEGKQKGEENPRKISTIAETIAEDEPLGESGAVGEEDKKTKTIRSVLNAFGRRKSSTSKRDSVMMKSLRDSEDNLPDPTLLRQWYTLDENAKPPVYRLQNISVQLNDYFSRDVNKRNQARFAWQTANKKLVKMLQDYSEKILTDPEAKKKYFVSMLHSEIEQGFLDTDSTDEQCFCVKRTISNLRSQLGESHLTREYMDLKQIDKVDSTRMNLINTYRNEADERLFNKGYLRNYEVEWDPNGIHASTRRSVKVYLDRMCKDVYENLKKRFDESTDREKQRRDSQRVLFDEVSYHITACQNRARTFQGRKSTIQLIKAYLKSTFTSPLVIHGQSGSGKTAILCKAAREVYKWFRGTSPNIILRLVGLTQESRNIRTLLRGICLQMCDMYGDDYEDVPLEYKGLVNDFASKIEQIPADNPLVIIIDGLDQLEDEHDGRKALWLPKELRSNVHIIVSVPTEDKYEMMENLKKLLGKDDDRYIEIPELPIQDAITILEHWLNLSVRTVTDEQYDYLLDIFTKCPTPLFLKMAFNEALTWTFTLTPDEIKLAETVKRIAVYKFVKLERDHEEPLVRRALGYIAATKNGITNNEMEDVISIDDLVMDDLMLKYKPPCRRLPTVLWVRLREELNEYLRETRADNAITYTWAHLQFFEAAQDRYLNQRDKASSYHKILAEYFIGQWANSPKPYKGNEKGAPRCVTRQDLFWEPEGCFPDGKERVFNLRKINELPYHLLHSQQMDTLKSECLCNYEWILAKLCGTSVRSLLEDYHAALSVEPKDNDFKLLSDAIQLSSSALMKDPRQLTSQVVGRLLSVVQNDIPRAPGDPKKYPYLHRFMDHAHKSSIPSLVPSMQCLREPGGILFDLLSGHTEPITAITIQTDGSRAVTVSKDSTLKLWNLRSGKVVKSIDGVGSNITQIRTALTNSLAVTVSSNVVNIWDIRSSACVHIIDRYLDTCSVVIAGERNDLLVTIFDGENKIRIWDLQNNYNMTKEVNIRDNSVHKEHSILVAANCNGDVVLHAFRSSGVATSHNARSGKLVHSLKCDDVSSSIVALGLTSQYYVLACRQLYMKLHEIHQLELFDTKKGKYLRSVRGCLYDIVSDIFINHVGSHAVAICASDQTETSNLAIWNLETEDHKHLAHHAQFSTMGACVDFRFLLTCARGENCLRVWDLTSQVNKPAPKLKKQLGIEAILPMIGNPRYCVAKAMNNGPVSVWNVANGKAWQSAVRVERGLVESSDIVLVRNTRLVILSDRGYAEGKPVFHTVFVYDLRSKKYLKKLKSHITPSPANEYVLLDDERLMGLSSDRRHFVTWSLKNGQVLYRIKSNFKESPRTHKNKKDHFPKVPLRKRNTTAKMTPWERRSESNADRVQRRTKESQEDKAQIEEFLKEKENSLHQYLMSGDQNVIVASFYCHHLCVFDIPTQTHTNTLENPTSMMLLHISALTHTGNYLVHANFDDEEKVSYVTLWNCEKGKVKRRLRKEPDVVALAITDDASTVIIGKENRDLKIWDTRRDGTLRKIKGFSGMQFDHRSRIFIVGDGSRAVVFAGSISLWDIKEGTMLSVFTPDSRIQCCSTALNGQLIVFGMYETTSLVILKFVGRSIPPLDYTDGEDVFGEKPPESSDEDEDED